MPQADIERDIVSTRLFTELCHACVIVLIRISGLMHVGSGRTSMAKVSLFTLGLWGIILAFSPLIVEHLARNEYHVHESGAVLVTGASTGIGNHAAINLAQRHPKVVVYAGVRKESDAEALAAQGIPNLRPVIVDIAQEDSVVSAHETIISELEAEGLPFIGLVNNAGISNNSPIEFLPLAKLRNVLNVNVVGTTHVTQLFIPELRKHKGRVVFISSILGLITFPTRGAYCASKWAMEALGDVLRVELNNFGASVSMVEPAYVRTEIFGKIATETQELVQGEAMDVYGSIYYRPEQFERRRGQIALADPPTVTTNAIEHALFDKHPKTRYIVANFSKLPAWVLAWVEWALPDRLSDLLKTKL